MKIRVINPWINKLLLKCKSWSTKHLHSWIVSNFHWCQRRSCWRSACHAKQNFFFTTTIAEHHINLCICKCEWLIQSTVLLFFSDNTNLGWTNFFLLLVNPRIVCVRASSVFKSSFFLKLLTKQIFLKKKQTYLCTSRRVQTKIFIKTIVIVGICFQYKDYNVESLVLFLIWPLFPGHRRHPTWYFHSKKFIGRHRGTIIERKVCVCVWQHVAAACETFHTTFRRHWPRKNKGGLRNNWSLTFCSGIGANFTL